jgi:hypothetical protein
MISPLRPIRSSSLTHSVVLTGVDDPAQDLEVVRRHQRIEAELDVRSRGRQAGRTARHVGMLAQQPQHSLPGRRGNIGAPVEDLGDGRRGHPSGLGDLLQCHAPLSGHPPSSKARRGLLALSETYSGRMMFAMIAMSRCVCRSQMITNPGPWDLDIADRSV